MRPAPDSTSGAKGYLPYWNDYTREISSALWSPTETVLQGLEQNSSKRLLERNGGELVVLNQRDISAEEELTADLLAILTVFGARVNGLRRYRKEIKEDQALPGRRARGAELRRWFGAARYAYNQAIELLYG